MRSYFESILPSSSILSASEDLDFYGKDSCKEYKSNAKLILLPTTQSQVVEIVKVCYQNSIALVPSGGRTGYSAGATATNGEVVISFEKLNRIIEVDPVARTLTCEAGVTTEQIQAAALKVNLFYGVDLASRGSSQIGGNIATNAGGIRVIRYGLTREWVLGLKVVTGKGELLNLNGKLIKNQSGLDLRSLFIGSEGILGIILEATLKLESPMPDLITLFAGFDNLSAVPESLKLIREVGATVSLFEYFDESSYQLVKTHRGFKPPFSSEYQAYAVIQLEASTKEIKEELLKRLSELTIWSDVLVANSESQAKELLAWREEISATIAKHHLPHKNDISVPVCKIVDFIQALSFKISKEFKCLVFGHIGDGNLHLNLLKPEKLSVEEFKKACRESDVKIFELVKSFSGSISAEHGIGLLKKDYISYSRSNEEVLIMKGIKSLLDPKNIMNSGKLI